MIIKIFSSLLMLQFVMNQTSDFCKTGCLQCGAEKKCKLCDFTQKYVNIAGECKLQGSTRCISINLNGGCLLCEPGFYPDTETLKCVVVPNPITNCQYYASLSSCHQCFDQHYLKDNQCLPVPTEIEFCQVYRNSTQCKECFLGYILQSDYLKCMTDPGFSNCAISTDYKCKQCKSGYVYNQNYYFSLLTDEVKVDELVNNMRNTFDPNILAEYCEKSNLKNCLEHLNVNECKTCQPGYFVNSSRKCEIYPEEIIPNCEIYSNGTTCQQCLHGYYLLNNACPKHNDIPNCEKYSLNSANACLECNENFYLTTNSSEICKLRSGDYTNCQVKNISEDQCQTCLSDFQMTSSGFKCLSKITNCHTYQTSNNLTTTHVCSKCHNGTYVNSDGSQCLDGTITNCDIYVNQQSCETCKHGFYMSNNTCLSHDAYERCEKFSLIQKNKCIQCKSTYSLFNYTRKCSLADPIDNCIDYEDKVSCRECKERYLLLDNQCQSIPVNEHCLRKIKNGQIYECSKCESGYQLNDNKECETHFEFQLEYCDQVTVYNDTQQTAHIKKANCDVCKPHSTYFDLNNQIICELESRIPQASRITNCEQYVLDTGVYYCTRCVNGKYLQWTNGKGVACLDTCNLPAQAGQYTVIKKPHINFIFNSSTPKRKYFHSTGIVCDNSSSTPGTVFVMGHVSTLQHNFALDCPSGYERITYYNFYKGTVFGQTTHIGITQFAKTETTVRCEQKTNAEIYHPPVNANNHCFSYRKKTYNLATSGTAVGFFCDQCKFGKTSQVKTYSNVNQTDIYYLDCDADINDCMDVKYGGLNFDKNAHRFLGLDTENNLKCHRCGQPDQIPFMFRSNGNTALNSQYDKYEPFGLHLADDIPNQSTNKNSQETQCLRPNKDELQVDVNKFTKTFVENCGVGYMDINKTKDFDASSNVANNSIYCIECKPGYKKIVDSNYNITKCEQIANCNTTSDEQWFNFCGKCQAGYNWSFFVGIGGEDKTLFDVCVPQTINHCMVSNGDKCVYCNKGYYLTDDKKFCNKITVSKCNDYTLKNIEFPEYQVTGDYYHSEFVIAYYLSSQSVGCVQCDTNYVGLHQYNLQQEQCAKSYILENDIQESQEIIANCVKYKGNVSLTCHQCRETHLLTNDNKKCINRTNFPHCTLIDSTTEKCIQCESNFTLFDDVCHKNNIENCTTLQQLNPRKCSTCAVNYRVSHDRFSCVLGVIQNCQLFEYNTGINSCQTCTTDLVQLLNGRKYCFNQIENSQCKTFDSNDLKTNKLKCDQCNSGYYLDTLQITESLCLDYQQIENCKTYDYDNSRNYQNQGFQCTECEGNFKVSGYGYDCIQRTLQITNCLTYHPTKEECQTCNTGYYLDFLKTTCKENPIGLQNCSIFENKETCTKCKAGYYLQNNECFAVHSQNIITDCIEYNSQQICTKCNTNLVLSQNQCKNPVANNCVTYQDINTCATCQALSYLSPTTQNNITITNCIVKSAPNCALVDDSTGNCSKCNSTFYLDSTFKCLKGDFINECIEYQSKDLCSKCSSTYYLAKDQKSCGLKGQKGTSLQPNCIETSMNNDFFCRVCKANYYFKDGQCTQCTAGEGCLICTMADVTKCQMCQSGYYQSEILGGCTKETSTTPKPNPTPSTFKIFQYSLLLIFLNNLI